jgi:hypothetical protein
MAIHNHGDVSYGGINAIESVEFCDCSGTQPSRGTIKFFPQGQFPDEDSDVVFTYNENVITIKDCHADSIAFEGGSGGQVCAMQFLDSRWRWAHRSITGRYNFRLPNNYINPQHEKTPQELATLLFQALGESVYDVSALPNDARPEANWDHANAAQELDRIVNDLGCRIVPVRSIGGWAVVVTGEGRDLPDFPAESIGEGLDPQETPDYIKIVTAPIRYQIQLPLEAIGKDTDLSWKRLKDISYAPYPDEPSGGFGSSDWMQFRNLDSVRFLLPDGTRISRQELARETIFNAYRIEFDSKPGCVALENDEWGIRVPTIERPVTRKQIILSNELVQMWTDHLGGLHRRSAYVCGTFWGNHAEGKLGNYADMTRIDKQVRDAEWGSEERASYTLSLDPLDTDRSIILVSPKLVKGIDTIERKNGDGIDYIEYQEADLVFVTSFQVRDPETWQPNRYEFLMQIGNGSDTNFCHTVIKDDIQPVVFSRYFRRVQFRVNTNIGEVVTQCRYYADALARRFQTVTSEHRTYIGLYPIDLDGTICQVTYSINGGGATTQASQGTEHSYYTPAYEERRQQVARHGIADQLRFEKYETARRSSYLGYVNT